MTIICSVHSINASCRSRHSPLQKLPLRHFGVLRSGRCHRPHPAERGSGADLPACLPRCRLVEYALSRSMSPTMVADYTLHLPDKAILQNKLRELTELALESGEGNEGDEE